MTKNLDKILFATDMDGTLLTTEKKISKENLSAIDTFVKKGGHFTIATGRSILSAQHYLDDLDISVPIIAFNGGAIYDLKTETILWNAELPDQAYDYVKDVMGNFPTVGIEVLLDKDIFVPNFTQMIHDHVVIEQLNYTKCALSEIPKGCIKVLFAAEPDVMDQLIEYIAQKGWDDVEFSRSAKEYYEILPLGVSKGLALKKLCEILDINLENTIAMGDYNNDIEMIKVAKIGIAMKDAPQEVKDIADLVTVSNDEHGVAVILNQVINHQQIIR